MNPYENVTDMKCVPLTEAQRALHQALLIMNEEQEVYEISVKKLCDKAGVARSTFYAYYTVIDDIVQEMEDSLLSEILKINAKFGTSDDLDEDSLDFFQENLDFMMENKKIFFMWLVKRPNHRFVRKWKRSIKYHFFHRVNGASMAQDKELILELIASQAIAAYTFWLQNPYEINIRVVKKLVLDTIKNYR